ncbi:MAG TPA: hypothetical protein VH166_02420 [Mycobacterium sp.]|nr:hypothetical protein [Mycobacterium sp.]
MTMPYNLRGPQTGDIRANPLNVMTATGTDYMMGAQTCCPATSVTQKASGTPTTSC